VYAEQFSDYYQHKMLSKVAIGVACAATGASAHGLQQRPERFGSIKNEDLSARVKPRALFATGMNGDEDLGQDITMKGEKFHYLRSLSATGMNGDEDLRQLVWAPKTKLTRRKPLQKMSKKKTSKSLKKKSKMNNRTQLRIKPASSSYKKLSIVSKPGAINKWDKSAEPEWNFITHDTIA